MNKMLTVKEHWHLSVYRDAIQEVFDQGEWVDVDGEDYWVIPEITYHYINRLLKDIEDV